MKRYKKFIRKIFFYLSMNNTYLFCTLFCLSIILDYFIIKEHFGYNIKELYLCFRNGFYIHIKIILFIVFLFIFIFFDFNWPDVDISNYIDIQLFLGNDENNKEVIANVGTNSTVNVNDPRINFTITKQGINNIAAAISAAVGATAGIKVAQYIAGPPSIKIIAGLGTMFAVQGITAIMSKFLNRGNDISKNLIYSFISNNSSSSNSNILNDYPLNLLVEVNLLLYATLLFLTIIFNIYLANYVLGLNYKKYLPNNKLSATIIKIIERYINLWAKAGRFLLIYSYILLFILIVIIKICIYTIIHFYN